MVRVVSTFALSGWGAFHAVSAAFYALSVSESGSLLLVSMVWGGPSSLLAVAHAALCGLCALAVLHLLGDGDMGRAEERALLALVGGLAVTAFAFLCGLGSESPGAYALFVAATLAGLAFDRRMALDAGEEIDEADHRAFLRLAAELGAEARRDRHESDRR